MAANMAENPQASLPEQAGSWAATQAAYRFLDNDRVTPQAIQAAAIEVTRRACGGPVTLMLHDLTPLDPVRPLSPTVLLQHTTLAVDGAPGGPLHGVMYQRAFDRPIQPQGESRRQRRGRWTQSRSWPDAVQAIGSSNGVGRWLHVADREADSFEMLRACLDAGHGFVIRAQHDRHLTDGGRLRETLWRKPIVGGFTVNVNAKGAVGEKAPINRRRVAQPGRIARCLVRVAQVTFAPPQNDPRHTAPLAVYAVHVTEPSPPADVDKPIDWLVLTSEPVADLQQAMTVVDWYRRRWLIEEFHKAQKTGCRLEQSQLRDREAFMRLAAIAALVAVRLIQLRDWADNPTLADTPAVEHVDDPVWVEVVSHVGKHADPSTLTCGQFYATIARLGGHLGRKGDGRAGWQTLWRGMIHVAALVQGVHLARQWATDARDVCNG